MKFWEFRSGMFIIFLRQSASYQWVQWLTNNCSWLIFTVLIDTFSIYSVIENSKPLIQSKKLFLQYTHNSKKSSNETMLHMISRWDHILNTILLKVSRFGFLSVITDFCQLWKRRREVREAYFVSFKTKNDGFFFRK